MLGVGLLTSQQIRVHQQVLQNEIYRDVLWIIYYRINLTGKDLLRKTLTN